MPKEMERRLKREAREKFKHIGDKKSRKERENAYVYGTMRATGWKPRREK